MLPGQGELQFEFVNEKLDGENYIERAFRFLANQRSNSFPSLAVEVRSDIPMKSGLGSSAAATVAGLRLFEAIAGPLPAQGLLNAACALENHPDNVAAALLGGLTLSCQLSDRSVVAVQMEWPAQLQLLVLTPRYALSTHEARGVLPERILREDAVFNLQHIALLLHCLQTGRFALLREALQDRLHQPFRQCLVPGLERASGAGTSGPSRCLPERGGAVRGCLCRAELHRSGSNALRSSRVYGHSVYASALARPPGQQSSAGAQPGLT